MSYQLIRQLQKEAIPVQQSCRVLSVSRSGYYEAQHGGQIRVLLSVTHAAAAQVKALVANVRAGLQHVLATAPQLPSAQRWQALARYIVEKIIAANATHPAGTAGPPALATG